MKVGFSNENLIIVPETEFEELVIRKMYGCESKAKVWAKHVSSGNDFIGIVIEKVEEI